MKSSVRLQFTLIAFLSSAISQGFQWRYSSEIVAHSELHTGRGLLLAKLFPMRSDILLEAKSQLGVLEPCVEQLSNAPDRRPRASHALAATSPRRAFSGEFVAARAFVTLAKAEWRNSGRLTHLGPWYD